MGDLINHDFDGYLYSSNSNFNSNTNTINLAFTDTTTNQSNEEFIIVIIIQLLGYSAFLIYFKTQENVYRKHHLNNALIPSSYSSYTYYSYNITGNLFYLIYNLKIYFDRAFKINSIYISDILISISGLISSLALAYGVLKENNRSYNFRPNDKLSSMSTAILVSLYYGYFLLLLLENSVNLYDPYYKLNERIIVFDSSIYLGYVKIFIMIVNYAEIICNCSLSVYLDPGYKGILQLEFYLL